MEKLKQEIFQVLKAECDGTYNEDISQWNISSPTDAPKVLFEKISQILESTVILKIKQWIKDRNLHTADPRIQMCKTVEELGELANAINKNKLDGAEDAIGDVAVTLICISEQLGLNFTTCMEKAYEEIKDRKGKMVNGVFVKEQDL